MIDQLKRCPEKTRDFLQLIFELCDVSITQLDIDKLQILLEYIIDNNINLDYDTLKAIYGAKYLIKTNKEDKTFKTLIEIVLTTGENYEKVIGIKYGSTVYYYCNYRQDLNTLDFSNSKIQPKSIDIILEKTKLPIIGKWYINEEAIELKNGKINVNFTKLTLEQLLLVTNIKDDIFYVISFKMIEHENYDLIRGSLSLNSNFDLFGIEILL